MDGHTFPESTYFASCVTASLLLSVVVRKISERFFVTGFVSGHVEGSSFRERAFGYIFISSSCWFQSSRITFEASFGDSSSGGNNSVTTPVSFCVSGDTTFECWLFHTKKNAIQRQQQMQKNTNRNFLIQLNLNWRNIIDGEIIHIDFAFDFVCIYFSIFCELYLKFKCAVSKNF